jgi:hypothetical protein
MTTLPERVYLKRKAVLQAVGGRSALEAHERAGELTRVKLTGYKCAHYLRAQVLIVVKKIHGDS